MALVLGLNTSAWSVFKTLPTTTTSLWDTTPFVSPKEGLYFKSVLLSCLFFSLDDTEANRSIIACLQHIFEWAFKCLKSFHKSDDKNLCPFFFRNNLSTVVHVSFFLHFSIPPQNLCSVRAGYVTYIHRFGCFIILPLWVLCFSGIFHSLSVLRNICCSVSVPCIALENL